MNVSSNASDLVSFQGLIEPVAGAATYVTSYFYAGDANAWQALISVGTVGTTTNAKIEQASDSSGTGVKDLSGSAITEINGDCGRNECYRWCFTRCLCHSCTIGRWCQD